MPPEPIQLVLIVAFEPDASPVPGELMLWRERLELRNTLPLPSGYRPLWSDGRGTLALVAGVGAARAASSVMALGLDARFDLSSAFFLVAGVAGADPARASLGSVVLPAYVVDGALTHELDAREIPGSWPDGFVPIGKAKPYEAPRAARFNGDDGIVFELNQMLVGWAHKLSQGIELQDTAAMVERRAQFEPAQGPPTVMRGEELSSTTFFHGRRMSERAGLWVDYQTDGRGAYAVTAMEDAGVLQALRLLEQAGRVDFGRVLILRGVSNYDQQRQGITAAESLAETRVASYSAYRPALENLVRVGMKIIGALRASWPGLPFGRLE